MSWAKCDTHDCPPLERVPPTVTRSLGLRPAQHPILAIVARLNHPFPSHSARKHVAVKAAEKAASLVGWKSFSGHSDRVGMAQDLAAAGVELPALMTAGRWKSSRMPARYTEGQAAGRGAVAKYYQGRGG